MNGFIEPDWKTRMADMPVSMLLGKTLTEIRRYDNKALEFITTEGEVYAMWHSQDCCEDVSIESVVGDLQDLVGDPLLVAEQVSSEGAGALGEWDESFTWTFYKFATRKGYVDIRWYGTSNGYYSESVDFALREVKHDPR